VKGTRGTGVPPVNSNQKLAGETPVPLFSASRWWLPPAAVSLILILIFVDPFIGDWDALEYTVAALRGQPSSMALGRSLFIFYNHALYVVAHTLLNVPPEHAYLLFKYSVVAQGPLAVIACWMLARDLSASFHAATVAALLLAFSPVFVIYSGQVMTDVPAVLLLTVALIVHLRGIQQKQIWLVLIGAAILGAGVNLRETVGLYGVWLAFAPFVCGWKLRRRDVAVVALSGLVFLFFAFGGFAYWFLTDPGYRAAWFGWRESMRVESARHPANIRNFLPWLAFFFATSPLVLISLPFAFVSEWRRRRLSPMLLLAILGLVADLLLLLNYSTSIGWRYLLTGLPAMAPLVSVFLMRTLTERFRNAHAALITAAVAIVILAVGCGAFLWPLRSAQLQVRAVAREYDSQLMKLPRDAVIISGAQTVAVVYWRGLGKGDWEVIGPGAGWPESRLASVIEDYLSQGRRVFVDVDPRWWQPCGWRVPEIEELVRLESRFRFRRVTETIYEIRRKNDSMATDRPELKNLLPENRPQDVKKCFN
jgi:Dolichyl-phosphate-mannose-protein mannosyltransferase